MINQTFVYLLWTHVYDLGVYLYPLWIITVNLLGARAWRAR